VNIDDSMDFSAKVPVSTKPIPAAIPPALAKAPKTSTAAVARPASPTVPPGDEDTRPTAVYVASLTWWTTDAELEQILAEFGRVKSLTFFTDKASGKSKGCCAVEFATADAAAACKERLHGREINGKMCVVTYAEIPKASSAPTLAPNAPLPPPPDTAWKGPIPPDKPGYGGVPLRHTQQQQQQMLLMQQQQMLIQQRIMMMQQGAGVAQAGGPPPGIPPPQAPPGGPPGGGKRPRKG
jgi:hypothetical protein